MLFKTVLPAVMLLAASVVASPAQRRQSSEVTCGDTVYDSTSIQDALDAGCQAYEDGTEAGDYPHTYNDYEGFSFSVSGPYLEYPIESDYAYDGGSPGASRVIFNEDCEYAGVITHDGASGDDFVACTSD